MRPEKVEKRIEKFEEHMDRDEYPEAKETLTELIAILGKEHPKAIALKMEYEMEAEE